MTAADALRTIERAGVNLRADGDRLALRPAHRVTAELVALARTHKPALLRLLRPTVDPIPAGGRDVLGLLDLGAMDAAELAAGLGWRHGETLGLLFRLRGIGVVRQTGARWILTPAADAHAIAPHAAAERRCGELLRHNLATPSERGERGAAARWDGTSQAATSQKPTLDDMGLTKSESSRYQQLAA